jgi:hypothetical protein
MYLRRQLMPMDSELSVVKIFRGTALKLVLEISSVLSKL